MPVSRSSRLPRLVVVASTAAASAAFVVTAGPATLAAADRLMTGQDIADRSIQKMDLADGAVRSRAIRKDAVKSHDIRNGTIQAEDLDAGLHGVVGPAGPAGVAGKDGRNGVDGKDGEDGKDGAPGVPGPSGQAEPDGVATWTVRHEADGTTRVQKSSTDTVPAGALIEPLDYTVAGDFSSCTGFSGSGGGSITFNVVRGNSTLLVIPHAGVATADSVQTMGSTGSGLQVDAYCLVPAGMGFLTQAPVPSFEASMTFQWTVRDTTPTTTFD